MKKSCNRKKSMKQREKREQTRNARKKHFLPNAKTLKKPITFIKIQKNTLMKNS